jgi:hypothetical protein
MASLETAMLFRHILIGLVLAAIAGIVVLRPFIRMLMTPATFSGGGIVADIVFAPLTALLPVPALAGAALLTFARITRAGVVLDDEVKATV